MAKVLIIEDDPLISRMYQNVFKFEGFDVTIARDGEDGIAKIKKDKPNMVLLDIMMPKKSGIEVLKEIKGNPDTKSIPVVVLTNLSGTKDADKAIELGAVKFIVKSEHKPKEIVQMVNQILKASTRDETPSS